MYGKYLRQKKLPSVGEPVKKLDYYLAVVCMLFVTIYCFINVICRLTIERTSASLDELNIIIFICVNCLLRAYRQTYKNRIS